MNTIKRVCSLLLLSLLPFLYSCSSSYVYDNLDWLVHWYVDDYVDLTPEQKKHFDKRFSQLQQWHRNNELIIYQQWLESVREQLLQSELTLDEARRHVQAHRQKTLVFWERLVEEAEPHLLVLLDQLSERQRKQLNSNIRQQMSERYKKKKAMGRQKWENEKIAQMKKGLKPWVGSLSNLQQQKLEVWAQSLHNVDALNHEFRTEWLSRLVELQKLPFNERRGQLAAVISSPDRFRSSEHLKLLEENRQLTEKAIAEVLVLRSRKQNQLVLSEIEQWLQRIKNARS